MKPIINLKSRLVQGLLASIQKEVTKALSIQQSVEKAVIPLATILDTKAHRSPKKHPEQVGSGVLLNIKDQYFILSATHVFNNHQNKPFFTAPPGHAQLEEISGERFSTGTLDNRVDKHDAAVFHIQNQISQELRQIAITLDDLDYSGYDSEKPIYMATGFLAKESNTAGSQMRTKAKNFPSVEANYYKTYNYDRNTQIILSYEDHVAFDDRWQLSPKPKGMSGGGIIKAQGTSSIFGQKSNKPKRQLLSAITIEQHKDSKKSLGYLLGTRINVHLNLIHKQLPGFLDDYIQSSP